DRKSTRLNSSHLVISYAVFCLKKNKIGGLRIRVPFPMHDRYSRADFHPGMQRLRGADVLAFSRDRHSLRSGDFGRSEDGGRVLIAALTQFRAEFEKDPSALLRWVSAGMRS